MPDQASGPAIVAAPSEIPLPRPRPTDATADKSADQVSDPAAASAPDDRPPAPTACRLALTEAIAIAPSVAPIKGPGACGGDDLVRLEAVVLPDQRRVAVKPAAILRCGMAAAVADWVRNDIAPLAASLDNALGELDNFDSFSCRGRNRVASAKLSEHGRANALDIRGIKLVNGRTLSLTDRAVSRDMREKVLASVCGRFTTVLGPGSDGYHEDHIHLDLAERRNGYRICQWQVYDPMSVTTPLPAPRPEEAPSREVASGAIEPPRSGEPLRDVEQLKVQPTAPPAVSLSPVPLANLPADVAKRVESKPVESKPVTNRRDTVRPETAKSGGVKTEVSKPDVARKQGAKPPRAKRSKSALSLAPSNNSAERKARPARRSKTTRSRARDRQPGLPALLRRVFD